MSYCNTAVQSGLLRQRHIQTAEDDALPWLKLETTDQELVQSLSLVADMFYLKYLLDNYTIKWFVSGVCAT